MTSLTQETPTTTEVPEGRRRSRSRVFWSAFALLMAVTSAWSLMTPIASGPDENAHIIKAAAVVRGDLHGHSLPGNPGAGAVDIPAIYAVANAYPVCFAFKGDVAADCAPDLPTGDAAAEITTASTWVIRNNPAYYAVVGLPSLLPPGAYTYYLMRLVNATLCSLVLAWAFVSLSEVARRPFVAVGIATAITPMVVYLNSIVNSSGLEISAALALWVSLLALVKAPDPARVTSRAAAIAVITVVLMNARGMSPLYVAAIVATVAVVVGPWSGFLTAFLDRRTWPWLGVIVAGTVPALWWTLSAGTLEGGGAGHPELTFLTTANRTFFDTGDFLIASIGRFGWFDTHLPMLAYIAFIALGGLPILLTLTVGDRRTRSAVVGVMAVAVLLPVLVHAWQASSVGYIWTARYSIPLFVGVAVAAGFLSRDAFAGLPAWIGDRVLGVVVPLLAFGTAVAFLFALRRYAIGDTQSWGGVISGEWAPPIHGLVLFAVEAVALAVGAWALVRSSRTDRALSSD